jgi:hypothetical protein
MSNVQLQAKNEEASFVAPFTGLSRWNSAPTKLDWIRPPFGYRLCA